MKKLIAILSIIFILITPLNVYGYSQNANGVDISNNNGTVDFNSIKANNINTVIIKATEGVSYVDNKLNTNYNSARALGFNIGFYHFFSNYTDPSQQAIDFYNAIKGYSYNIYPVLDVETNKLGVSREVMTNRVIQFLQTFKTLSGQDCIIYTYSSFINESLDYYKLIDYQLWIASYGSYYSVPSVWASNVCGWQYTDSLYINNKRFDGNNFGDRIYLGNKYSNTVSTYNTTDPQYILSKWSWKGWVKQFQSCTGSYVDGITGPITLSKCPTLRYGATGESVKRLQEVLQASGYWGCIPDGIFGEYTARCVIDFQYRHGLSTDGIVGRQTWRKILGI